MKTSNGLIALREVTNRALNVCRWLWDLVLVYMMVPMYLPLGVASQKLGFIARCQERIRGFSMTENGLNVIDRPDDRSSLDELVNAWVNAELRQVDIEPEENEHSRALNSLMGHLAPISEYIQQINSYFHDQFGLVGYPYLEINTRTGEIWFDDAHRGSRPPQDKPGVYIVRFNYWSNLEKENIRIKTQGRVVADNEIRWSEMQTEEVNSLLRVLCPKQAGCTPLWMKLGRYEEMIEKRLAEASECY